MKIGKTALLDLGYEAPSTDQFITDLAEWDTAGYLQIDEALLSGRTSLPSLLVIRVKPTAVPLKTANIGVSLITPDKILKSQPLYSEESLHYAFDHDLQSCQISKINLFFEGSDHEEILNFNRGDLIYTKPFAIQTQSLVEEKQGGQDRRKLYGYGGRYREGLNLGECEPVFFELCEGYQKTEVSLSTYSQWRQRGIQLLDPSAFRGHKIDLDPSLSAEHLLNLGAALAGGYAKLQVVNPDTEEVLTFYSTQGQRPHDHPHLIDITFTRQEGVNA